jgi:L-serine dehydratase
MTGKECALQGSSVGGGNILITSVNHLDTEFSGAADTLIIAHRDMPGMIASVSSVMGELGINIGNFKLNRPHKGFQAVMVLETDGAISAEAIMRLRSLPHIDSVVYLRPNQNEG